jgi:hypothetical protein
MSEGPVNFGKPLFFLVLIGCVGGGYYAWQHWPSTYNGAGYSVDMPHGWTAAPANDPSDTSLVRGSGPLPKMGEDEQSGTIWMKLVLHGTLDWDMYMRNNIPGTPDWTQDDELDYKKARLMTYEDQTNRFFCGMVDRGDALVIVGIGTTKANFEFHRKIFEKCIRSIKCTR